MRERHHSRRAVATPKRPRKSTATKIAPGADMRERRRAYGGVSGQELHSVRLRLTQVDHRPGRQRPLSVQNVPMDPPRNRQQRRTDTLAKLGAEADVWVATANADGSPYLVPLSLFWDGKHVVVSAQRESRTI